MDKYFYKAVTANRQYKSILVESRNGINISENALIRLDETISPLILNGQTPYEILEAHSEISQCVKTIYNYIENGALSVKNIDLPRKVKYKIRKAPKSDIKDTGIFEGRTYKDYLAYMEAHPDTNVVEMDTVVGREGSHKVFLTLYFRNCHCMLIYLLPDKTNLSVKAAFDCLEKKLTTFEFLKAFPIILTDRGTEFSNPVSLEIGADNLIRTNIYYCDPMASWQKAALEKNHEFIRYVLPKGSSFDNLTQWDATKLANHINSTARASLNGQSPFKLAFLLLGENAVRAFGLRQIASDSIVLTPDLLKSN
jgi:IS30 family transposase